LLDIKRNFGHRLEYLERRLLELDRHCRSDWQGALGRVAHSSETGSMLIIIKRRRAMSHLSKLLRSLAMEARIGKTLKAPKPAAPHIFTDARTEELFGAIGSLSPVRPLTKIAATAAFKTIAAAASEFQGLAT
jgi:hypothetical protein